MNFQHRSYNKELLDKDDIPFEDIRKNMQELEQINTWLGGHKISIKGLKKLIGAKQQLVICEIGCGGGDNINALMKWCNTKAVNAKFLGVDIKAECIDFARSKAKSTETEWIVSDYKKVDFNEKPDIIFSSLFCHHYTNDELADQIVWMKRNSNIGFFINDLQRHWLAYYSIKLLTAIFSSSYLVKNDAPLSVARGFKKKDWNNIFQKAGLANYNISWQWAFRYLITYNHATRNSI